MKNRVQNGTLGKIIRTFGFLLLLISSTYVASLYIFFNDSYVGLAQLSPYAIIVLDFLITLPAVLSEYIGLAFFAGIILIIWVIRKGLIVRVVLTVALVFLMIHTFIAGNSPIEILGVFEFPSWLDGLRDSILPTYTSILGVSEFVIGGVSIGVTILFWYVCANKKPGRFSLVLIRSGSTLLFLSVLMAIVSNQIVTSLATFDLYVQAMISLFTLSYLILALGSLFGVLGFYRK